MQQIANQTESPAAQHIAWWTMGRVVGINEILYAPVKQRIGRTAGMHSQIQMYAQIARIPRFERVLVPPPWYVSVLYCAEDGDRKDPGNYLTAMLKIAPDTLQRTKVTAEGDNALGGDTKRWVRGVAGEYVDSVDCPDLPGPSLLIVVGASCVTGDKLLEIARATKRPPMPIMPPLHAPRRKRAAKKRAPRAVAAAQ